MSSKLKQKFCVIWGLLFRGHSSKETIPQQMLNSNRSQNFMHSEFFIYFTTHQEPAYHNRGLTMDKNGLYN